MKIVFYSVMMLMVWTSCKEKTTRSDTGLINITPSATNNRSSDELPEIEFTEDVFDFGTIIEGKQIEYTFHFENTGTSDLIISSVQPSCGCTAIKDWSKEPFSPGEKGDITIVFDSNNRPGKIDKSITVSCNTYPSATILKMSGMVIGPQ